MFELDTTEHWDALGLSLNMQQPNAGDHIDIVIGFIDSGICSKSKSFAADGIKPPPSSWKGNKSNDPNFTCTNKIVGAQTYTIRDESKPPGYNSIGDYCGHGTQCAAIAAGNPVSASFHGYRKGIARGGLPKARIAAYKVMTAPDKHEAFNIYSAITTAIKDGVDILSICIGERDYDVVDNKRKILDYYENEISLATFEAMKAGILSCVSAGNYEDMGTVGNLSPWQFCCGASTSCKTFTTTAVLGKGSIRIKGSSLNTFPDTQVCPLIYATSAKKKKVLGSENIDSRVVGSLDKSKVKGKIVVYKFQTKGKFAFEAGASGIIVISKGNELPRCKTFLLPAVCVTKIDGDKIVEYMDEEFLKKREPVGRIFPSVEVANQNYPYLASFSSKGPNQLSPYVLKPDICAPGVDILTATSTDVPGEKRMNPYTIVSGTSMATGMLTGAAAYIKSKRRNWSPAAIKSALMTTASSMKIKNSFDVLGFGAGLMNPIKAVDPGLIYDIKPEEYQDFLDGHEEYMKFSPVNEEALKAFRSWDLNLPSFAACLPSVGSKITFHRKVNHVGRQPTCYYRAFVSKLESLEVEVEPKLLYLNTKNKEIQFQVTVTLKDWSKCKDGVLATSLEWKSSQYSVKSPIVIVQKLQL